MFKILVDADSSPVKQEVYRVARRYSLKVVLAANSSMVVPTEEWLEMVVVGSQLDAADDWIVEHINKNDILVTGDIPLAARSLKKGARVLSPKGLIFTEGSIGNMLATRDLLTHLRDIGINTSGPSAFSKKDRSRFLQALDNLVQANLNGR
jgi:uncharacterized protein YaiI (UPF0178 family)